MKKVLLDTNTISSLFRGDEKVLEQIIKADRVYFSIFVLGELFFCFNRGYVIEIKNTNTKLRMSNV